MKLLSRRLNQPDSPLSADFSTSWGAIAILAGWLAAIIWLGLWALYGAVALFLLWATAVGTDWPRRLMSVLTRIAKRRTIPRSSRAIATPK